MSAQETRQRPIETAIKRLTEDGGWRLIRAENQRRAATASGFANEARRVFDARTEYIASVERLWRGMAPALAFAEPPLSAELPPHLALTLEQAVDHLEGVATAGLVEPSTPETSFRSTSVTTGISLLLVLLDTVNLPPAFAVALSGAEDSIRAFAAELPKQVEAIRRGQLEWDLERAKDSALGELELASGELAVYFELGAMGKRPEDAASVPSVSRSIGWALDILAGEHEDFMGTAQRWVHDDYVDGDISYRGVTAPADMVDAFLVRLQPLTNLAHGVVARANPNSDPRYSARPALALSLAEAMTTLPDDVGKWLNAFVKTTQRIEKLRAQLEAMDRANGKGGAE